MTVRFPRFVGALALCSFLVLSACDQAQLDGPAIAPSSAVSASQSAAQGADPVPTGTFIVLGKQGRSMASLQRQVESVGGVVTTVIPEIGVLFVTPGGTDFATRAARLSDVDTVVPDYIVQWTNPIVGRGDNEIAAEGVAAQEIGAAAAYRGLQWFLEAVDAPQAWEAGYTGQGVRVAILDGGIFNAHPDLAGNVDVAASRSFTTGAWNTDTGTFWHGTHVAGIVAATGDVGVVGIAPRATLVGVKVLHSGSGPFEAIINGIVYAAKPQSEGGAGSHVINMSLGATFDQRGNWGSKAFRDAFRDLMKAIDRASVYAYQQGTTVLASAGNGATNFDVARDLFKTPAQNQHVISVSSTGPHGWALGSTDFTRRAYYSDYGRSLVDISAPGGTLGLWVVDGYDGLCTVEGITNWCEVFDQVLSTSRAGWSWAQGTSMASPAAAGVAALIIERNGGQISPHAVRTALQRSAADIGVRGNNEFYGLGWVNAYNAVR